MSPAHDTLGSRVRMRRDELDLTQTELARTCKCTVTTISSIECGRHEDVSRSTLRALADALGVSMEWLDEGTRAKPARRTS